MNLILSNPTPSPTRTSPSSNTTIFNLQHNMSNLQPNMSWTKGLPRPFHEGDNIYRTAPPVVYEPLHPLIRLLSKACAAHDLPTVKGLVDSWHQNQSPSGPSAYPIGALEPTFYEAIGLDDAPIASYLLDEGVSLCQLAILEALEHKCTSSMWQVFLDHGWDINAELHHKRPPPLAYVASSQPKALTERFGNIHIASI